MYNVIIVDDEEVARLRLRRLLQENFNDLTIIAEAEDGISAIEAIQNNKPDLVFLDIDMPGISGIEVAKACCSEIPVIFITAHEKYVFDAFKSFVVDYILKPIDAHSLEHAVTKFRKMHGTMSSGGPNGTFSIEADHYDSCERFKITNGNMTKLFNYEDLVYFEADKKYVTVYTEKMRCYFIDESLNQLEHELPGDDFIRIHRKYIVNRRYVDEIKRCGDRNFTVVLKTSTERELKVGRNFIPNIKQIQ